MDTRPIGVFDSGVGGLTALKELLRVLPREDAVYFGDLARVPYGMRDRDTIVQLAKQDQRFLMSLGVKAVLVACGTVTATSLPQLQAMADVSVLGVIEPASRAAAAATKNKKILVLGTQATVKSSAYAQAIGRIDGSIEVMQLACPPFVPLIESGHIGRRDPQLMQAVAETLAPVKDFGADTVILGCTHYPIIQDTITDYLGDVTAVNCGKESVADLARLLEEKGLNNSPEHTGVCKYYVSGNTEQFIETAGIFLNTGVEDVSLIDIEAY